MWHSQTMHVFSSDYGSELYSKSVWFDSQLEHQLCWLKCVIVLLSFQEDASTVHEVKSLPLPCIPTSSLFSSRATVWRYIVWVADSVIKQTHMLHKLNIRISVQWAQAEMRCRYVTVQGGVVDGSILPIHDAMSLSNGFSTFRRHRVLSKRQ